MNHGGSGVDSPSLTCQQTLSPPPRQLATKSHYKESSDSSFSSTALTFSPRQPAWECTFSLDGTWLAVAYGAPDPVLRIWKVSKNPKGGEYKWVLHSTLAGIHEKTVRSVDFAPLLNKPVLASASFDGTVAIWELEDEDWISTAQLEGHDTEVKNVRWNATGSLLATCGRDKSVWVWECFLEGTVGGGNGAGDDQFECLAVLNGHQGDVKCVRFASSHGAWGDGDEILLSASYDNTIRCWAEDAGDWYCAFTIEGVHASTIWSMAVSPSGARLVAGAGDGSLSVYKCYTKQEAQQTFPDESAPASAVWKCVGTLKNAHYQCTAVYSVHYASAKLGHGRIVSSGGDNRIQILREASSSTLDQPQFSTEVDMVTSHGDVNSVVWHPKDGSVLASAGDDGQVRIWKYSS